MIMRSGSIMTRRRNFFKTMRPRRQGLLGDVERGVRYRVFCPTPRKGIVGVKASLPYCRVSGDQGLSQMHERGWRVETEGRAPRPPGHALAAVVRHKWVSA